MSGQLIESEHRELVARITGLRKELANCQAQTDRSRDQMAQAGQRVLEVEQVNAVLHARAAALEHHTRTIADVEALTRLLAEAEQRVLEVEQANAGLHAQAAALLERQTATAADVEALTRLLAEIEASPSWKLTSPLRRAKRGLLRLLRS